MPGLSVMLPLVQDKRDGRYRLNKTLEELVRQDFKNLMLTIPGERILIPDYGVGILQYLFEQTTNVQVLQAEIVSRISDQVQRFMPYLEIRHVDFNFQEDENPHLLKMTIYYKILPLSVEDFLELGDKLGNV